LDSTYEGLKRRVMALRIAHALVWTVPMRA